MWTLLFCTTSHNSATRSVNYQSAISKLLHSVEPGNATPPRCNTLNKVLTKIAS